VQGHGGPGQRDEQPRAGRLAVTVVELVGEPQGAAQYLFGVAEVPDLVVAARLVEELLDPWVRDLDGVP
jgi:hypothetical protein